MPALDLTDHAVGTAHNERVGLNTSIVANNTINEAALGHTGCAEDRLARGQLV